MNKKDLSHVKKQFKKDRSTVKVNSLFSVYINSDSKKIIADKSIHFDYLEDELKELFFKNFKKVLTGNMDVKLFEREYEVAPRNIVNMTSSGEILSKTASDFISHFISNYPYNKSVVLNIAQFTLYREKNSFDMVICSINKTNTGKPQYIYDHTDQDYVLKSQLDPEINLSSPLDGFMYPVYEDDSVDNGKILYYSSKSNKINAPLLQNVLGCEIKLTANQEKKYFHTMVREIMGGRVSTKKLHEIYEIIEDIVVSKGEEGYLIDIDEMHNIISEVDQSDRNKLEEFFKNLLGSTDYAYKGENIIPDFGKKSILLSNNESDIKINPNNLGDLKKIQSDQGENFLVIRLSSELETDGFEIEFDESMTIRTK